MTSLSSSVISSTSPTIPIAVPVQGAVEISGMSRSAVYRELANGNLRAVKSGSRTLVLVESIRSYLANLPAATFRQARAA